MQQHIAVIDIGKTNAKIMLIEAAAGTEVMVLKGPNHVLPGPPYPHYDEPALWDFILGGLRKIGEAHHIDSISITTHGASCALTDMHGNLVLPALDYEFGGPDALQNEYDRVRPPFAETGSPRLPAGLNVGAQLFWLSHRFADEFSRTKHILTWPQYWAMKLTGVAASEPTSLGCHTDLWDPWHGQFSSLVTSQGWQNLFPPVKPANAVLGPLKAEVAACTGLDPATPVHNGIHDSNASLLPYLDGPHQQFAVMSTGTWMITLAVGGSPVTLDVARDTLVNVNAKGQPTPTSRYMAGREFDEITQGKIVTPSDADRSSVLSKSIMALPSLHPDTGPFPGGKFAWQNGEPANDAERTCAASFYAAMMGAECLRLVGAAGVVFVEGPFGANREFLEMLATASGLPVVASGQTAGTGLGAAMLAGKIGKVSAPAKQVLPSGDPLIRRYVTLWKHAVASR